MLSGQHGEANRDEMFFEVEETQSSQRFSFAPQPPISDQFRTVASVQIAHTPVSN